MLVYSTFYIHFCTIIHRSVFVAYIFCDLDSFMPYAFECVFVLECSRMLCFVGVCVCVPVHMLLHAIRLFNVNFSLGQLNVSRSIILYLNSPEQKERKERERDEEWFSRWMDG